MTSRLRHGGALVLTAAALLLAPAGCGSANDSDADARGSAGPAALEASGTVAKGVEAGCLVFRPDNRGSGELWTLTGEVGDLRPGQRVTVRGALQPDAVSFCQQGQVFEVAEVLRR